MKKDRIEIVYEDKHIIVVNKPYNLLTISTENEKEKTMFHKVFSYIKSKNKNSKVFIVHRLDKDTSGLIIFAKGIKEKQELQSQFEKSSVKRGYIALVEGKPEKEEDTIKSYIAETKTLLSYSTKDTRNGKLAITKYKMISSNNMYSLLDINISTGRKNQIRLHMKDIKHPIVGDSKYDSKYSHAKRMYLHANVLEFVHPNNKKTLRFELPIPKDFTLLLKNNK